MVAAGPGWVGGGALRARRMHTWRCAGAARRSQAERPAGGPAGGVLCLAGARTAPTPVRAAFCGPFLPLRESGRTYPVNNIRAVPSHYVAMVAAGPGWVGGGALRARRMHTWRCAGAARRSQAERPAGGPAGGVLCLAGARTAPTPVRAAFCGPFLPLRESGRTYPVNNIRAVPSHYVARYAEPISAAPHRFCPCPSASQGRDSGMNAAA